MSMLKKQRTPCLNCGNEPDRPQYKYCSNTCQSEYQYKSYIEKWKKGFCSGLQGHGVVSRHVKRYLRDKFHNRCHLCGWAKTNPITKQVPLVADHIDGNWHNNVEDNLRLICPNCDALSATYAGLNRGNGRTQRSTNKRANWVKSSVNNIAGVTQG